MDLVTAIMQDIVADESFRQFVYDDATGLPLKRGDTLKGYPTVAYGLNLQTEGISEEEGHALAVASIQSALAWARTNLGYFYSLTPNRQRAVVEMIYQLGVHGFLSFKSMRNNLSLDFYDKAADDMLNSKWNQQTPSRCHRLASLMRAG